MPDTCHNGPHFNDSWTEDSVVRSIGHHKFFSPEGTRFSTHKYMLATLD